MASKKYRVKLSQTQRAKLQEMTRRGELAVRKYKRARVLLLADEASDEGGKKDAEIAELADVSVSTVVRVRRRFVQEGLEGALNEKPRPGKPRVFSGRQRAAITALATSEPPEGRARWSLRLLAEKAVELEIVESISHKGIRGILKKTISSPISSDNGALEN